jgi:heme O synthase-like polyprenyltransferase
VFGSLGIWLAAASAAAINHLLDRRIDALMARTDESAAADRLAEHRPGARLRDRARRGFRWRC